MVMPGDTVTFKVKLVAPVALEERQRFAIREGVRLSVRELLRRSSLKKIPNLAHFCVKTFP